MSQWVRQGIRTGLVTTRYPTRPETAAGVSPGRPLGTVAAADDAAALIARCPTGALSPVAGGVAIDYRHCIHCYRCVRGLAEPVRWSHDYEWAAAGRDDEGRLGQPFRRSTHIIVVDAGDCGACLHEVKQLSSPYYNMHRLGFFITPTPRHADILLVVGPVTDQVRVALRATYDAMPTPKRVVAVGTCALSGGVFGPSFTSEGGVADVLPVDVEVPGQPPPPLAILHGLLVAVGRKAPVPLVSLPPAAGTAVAR